MDTWRKTIKGFKKVVATALAVCLGLLLFPPVEVESAGSAAKEAFRLEMRQMLYEVDTSKHDISKYNLSPSEMLDIFYSFKTAPEDKWMVAAYYSNLTVGYTYSGNTVRSVYLKNVDEDVKGRYQRLLANVGRIKAGIEPSMKQLDKIIYLHDCIDELATYKFVAYQSYGAGGILGDGLGVCSGYTKAYNLLLEDQGITACYLASAQMDHGWTSVFLDGNWYHIDCTWDDTLTRKRGYADHRFLLLNDEEISAGQYAHYGWENKTTEDNISSDSKKFSNWYVHDIAGKMAFENGYWYYVDAEKNCIMRDVAEGGKSKVVLDAFGQSAIELVDATPAGIIYRQNGVEKTAEYIKDPIEASEETVKTTPAAFYLQLEEGGAFVSVGSGAIKEAKTSKDQKYVESNIASTPDVSKWLQPNQVAEWKLITKSGAGKYFVKGQVKTVEAEVQEPEEPEVLTGDKAVFYFSKEGVSGLINAGTGLISEGGTASNDEAIQKRIVLLPDSTIKYVGDDEYIAWVKLTTYTNGKTATVRGEIKKK